ncbi:MAG: hypothetical protein FJ291_13240 [Planctomycetes bacterium]|nr:hypothetical protein [Planctomycetota bacterium]
MVKPPKDPEGFARQAEEYYARALRAKLEPNHKGEYVVLDVESGDYEVDSDEMAALDRARAKHPDRLFYILRVGYRASVYIGARAGEGLP